jgi:hypothetical protein
VYDHIVVVVEENKDFEQILGVKFDAPFQKIGGRGRHIRAHVCRGAL